MSDDWDLIEATAEEHRNTALEELAAARIPPLDMLLWEADLLSATPTNLVMPEEDNLEEALRVLRHKLKTRIKEQIFAAGVTTVCSSDTLFSVWGLHIDEPFCLVQYIEHRVDGSRIWLQKLSTSFAPIEEWDLAHMSFMQRIEPIFYMGRATPV